jgi:hypothetical protein
MNDWVSVQDPCGGWYWVSGLLPNGWRASVSDISQSIAPRQTTEYQCSAACASRIVFGPAEKTFADAKRSALLLAMNQDIPPEALKKNSA